MTFRPVGRVGRLGTSPEQRCARIGLRIRTTTGLDCLGNDCHGNGMAYYDAVPFTHENSIGYLARRIHQQAAIALEPVFAREGITMTQWSTLVSIMLERATTCADLARDLAHDKGAMTRLLDQLEERGLVGRERSGDDRRFVRVAITAAGRAVAERCRGRVAACWNGWVDGLAHEDVDRTIASLRGISDKIDAAPAECAA